MPDWGEWRETMRLDPSIVNLNTGSFGPTPQPVRDEANRWREQLAAEPTNFYVRVVPEPLWRARTALGAYLNVAPERLVFTSNVSASINLVASGLTLTGPGEILLSDHEYGAMHWCWERAARRQGLTLRTFPLPHFPEDPGEIVEACARAITPKTRLLFFSHVLSPTGMVLPAKELVALARRRGVVTVIDGAHAPAMIPLDVSAIGADFYGGNCHKWLLAPHGCGFLALGPGSEDRLQPLHVSWGYHNTSGHAPDARDEWGSTPRTRFLEFEGTRDVCPWLALPAAIDYQAGIGPDAIRGRMRELSDHARRIIGDEFGLRCATPAHPAMRGSLTGFELPPGRPAQWWRDRVWRHRIEVPIVERPDRTMVRVSGHFYNTEAEIDLLAGVLRDLLGEDGERGA